MGDFPHLLPLKEVREKSLICIFLFVISADAIVKWVIQCKIHQFIHHLFCQRVGANSDEKSAIEGYSPHLLPLKEGGEGNFPHLHFVLRLRTILKQQRSSFIRDNKRNYSALNSSCRVHLFKRKSRKAAKRLEIPILDRYFLM